MKQLFSSLIISIVLLILRPSDAFSPAASSSSSSSFVTRLQVTASDPSSSASQVTPLNANVNVNDNVNPETASLQPGQILTIKIGDTSNARKAWKKRRRSGSPLLVPCTVLGMNRHHMVMYNLVNLLHRFGRKYTSDDNVVDVNMNANNSKGNSSRNSDTNGLVLSVGAIVKLYKYRLGGDLLSHARAMGYPTIVSYLKAAFGEKDDNNNGNSNVNVATENLNGVSLVRIGHKRELALCSTLSMKLARESASQAEFVQFAASNIDVDIDVMKNKKNWMSHTGTTFQITSPEQKYQTIVTDDLDHGHNHHTNIQPLSAAVRISQDELSNLNRLASNDSNSECNAFVHSYDLKGDNGSPLLICTIDPPKTQILNQMKRRAYVMRKKQRQQEQKQQHTDADMASAAAGVESQVNSNIAVCDLKDLNAGEGPYNAKIIHISQRAGAAFVDMGVYRLKGKKHGGGKAHVLGMLRFDDVVLDGKGSDNNDSDSGEEADIIKASIQEGEGGIEIEEDVSDLYSIDQEGNVSMLDPDTQEVTLLGSIDEESANDEVVDADDEDNMFAGMTPEERLSAIGEMLAEEERNQSKETKVYNDINDEKKPLLQVGNEIEVYVRAVFPQSGRFMVTTDKRIQEHKLRDLKQEREAEKRLSRLASKMGGEKGLQTILDCVGEEMEGKIKASSKTGDWYYVQPLSGGLPVGIGSCQDDGNVGPLSSGDKVQIRIEGIDYSRGQLSLQILEKI